MLVNLHDTRTVLDIGNTVAKIQQEAKIHW